MQIRRCHCALTELHKRTDGKTFRPFRRLRPIQTVQKYLCFVLTDTHRPVALLCKFLHQRNSFCSRTEPNDVVEDTVEYTIGGINRNTHALQKVGEDNVNSYSLFLNQYVFCTIALCAIGFQTFILLWNRLNNFLKADIG